MSIQIKTSNRKATPDDIASVEAKIGVAFPQDYRAFLLKSNGGKPENNIFKVPDDKTDAGVELFYGALTERGSGDLLYEYKVLMERIPEKILPIAEASCGNRVCLSLRPDTFGQVFFWDHELEPQPGTEASFSNLFRIGDSFDNFFSHLKVFDPESVELKPGQVKRVQIDPEFLRFLKRKQ